MATWSAARVVVEVLGWLLGGGRMVMVVVRGFRIKVRVLV
ncbi:hypothetical protein Pint_05057 [Pistacia integerrima]|uniref:Uncharacterized protein n=1 Tax=Pistacia integerrima TaxID=434235 RepID=A0ACC0Z1P8_9ROSI|nr:hypothetical protein Pint_05057 [Pistacia integerrima]